jgi:hypothetical protein
MQNAASNRAEIREMKMKISMCIINYNEINKVAIWVVVLAVNYQWLITALSLSLLTCPVAGDEYSPFN